MIVRTAPLLALALIGCHRRDLDALKLCERAIRNGSDAPDLVELLTTRQVSPARFVVNYRPYNGRPGPVSTATCSLVTDERGRPTARLAARLADVAGERDRIRS